MFKNIVSRDNGEPWGPTGMTTQKWLHIPTHTVTIADLTATQPGLLLHALNEERTPVGGDPTPHVIQWHGNLYLEDGHHRAARALLNGCKTIEARILNLDPTTTENNNTPTQTRATTKGKGDQIPTASPR